MIKELAKYDKTFWACNYPVQLLRNKITEETTFVMYIPSKESCWNSRDEFESVPKEDINDFIDNSIEQFKKAIQQFEKYKNGEVDSVYFWDEL